MKRSIVLLISLIIISSGFGEIRRQEKINIIPAVFQPPQVLFPQKLMISKLGLEAEIERVGLTVQKRMDVPKDWNNTGWYELGAKPGEQGKAVIAGHLDSPTGPAIFYDLDKLDLGDEIRIVDQGGDEFIFVVTSKQVFPDAQFPIDLVFGKSEEKLLNLITCDGVWNKADKNYSDRLVVFSKLQE